MNIVTWDLRLPMNASAAAAPHGMDEFELPVTPGCLGGAKAEKGTCQCIDAPCVANAPLRLECRVREILTMSSTDLHAVVIGEVVLTVGACTEAVAARGGYITTRASGRSTSLIPPTARRSGRYVDAGHAHLVIDNSFREVEEHAFFICSGVPSLPPFGV